MTDFQKNICKSLAIVLFAIVTIDCKNNSKTEFEKKTIYISNLRRAILGNGVDTGVRIIKTYPNEDNCLGNQYNANLYICKNTEDNDTLYVFSICDKVPSFAKVDLNEIFAIDHGDIKKNVPDKVIIKVPKTFSIPSNAKYVFSKLTRIED
ncbi:hypothetical protein [Pedobacter nutrimenti]|uniref:Uncharacterized protein n=1 Tax=Pedobacter nutrimenti TaxID=1241337 RepID=A0A318UDT6_9SPHI|nr:hypothetical protein [Pedobacter nutrimenti]PYF74243.1 hypothetical protein B0O44_104414 [Pedobacter nutrimenti]